MGSATALEPTSVPVPGAGAGEIRIRVRAVAMNPADNKTTKGLSGSRFIHANVSPLVVGFDFAGEIDELGADVHGLSRGDRLFGFLPYSPSTRNGTLAHNVIARADQVARMPEQRRGSGR
jgi:NADPH:quinone reductase-like Zn-dependent oxidoreductase